MAMKHISMILAVLALSYTILAVPAFAQYGGGSSIAGEEQVKLQAAADVLSDAMSLSAGKIPDYVLKSAFGIAVFPNIARDALYAGGGRGEGAMVVRTDVGIWSDPIFLSFADSGLGAQLAPYVTDVVLVFRNRETLRAFQNGKLKVGMGVTAAPGPTYGNPNSVPFESSIGIYTYAKVQDSFQGINPGGITLKVNNGANGRYYDASGITPGEIIAGEVPAATSGPNPLTCLLSSYTGTAQVC